MNQIFKVGVALSALAVLTTSAFASTITGTWRGHIKVDASKAPDAATTEHKARINKVQQTTLVLVVNANHTFQMGATGMPNRSGTWTQTGNSLTLQGVESGKNMGPAETFTVGKNNVLSMTQTNPKSRMSVTVTFNR